MSQPTEERPIEQLNQRELLILIKMKVEQLETKMDQKSDNDIKILLDINTLKVTLRERSVVWGMVGSILMTGLIQLLIYFFTK